MLAVVVMVSVAAALAIDRLSTSPESGPGTTVPPATTIATFAPADREHAGAELGDPLDWEHVLTIGGPVLAVLEHDERFFLFAGTEPGYPPPTVGGMNAWVSPDGRQWTPLGTIVTAQHTVESVVSTGNDLVAIGSRLADGQPMVWSSPDGVTWTQAELPLDHPLPSPLMIRPTQVASTDGVVVVIGALDIDRSAVFDDLGIAEDASRFTVSVGGPPLRIEVRGHLGIPLHVSDGAELGLTDDEMARVFGERVNVWRSIDGERWESSTIAAMRINSLVPVGEGRFAAFGYGRLGPGIWGSVDGIEWTRTPAPTQVQLASEWKGQVLGVRLFGSNPTLLSSEDGRRWQSLGMGHLLPEEHEWLLDPVTANEEGILVGALGMERGRRAPLEVTSLEGDHSLVGFPGGWITLLEGSRKVVRILATSVEITEIVDYDLPSGTLTFVEEGTNDPIATFSLSDVAQAEERSGERVDLVDEYVLFSTDGLTWSVHDLSEMTGETRPLVAGRPAERTLVAALGPPRHSPASTSEVWLGTVPSNPAG